MNDHHPTRPEQERKSIAAEEWDFSRCPDNELACCCYYEYARMIDSIKERVVQLRTSGDWGLGLYPGDAAYYPEAWFRNFFRRLPEFPLVPWLKIDPATRRDIRLACEKIEGPFIGVGPERYFNEAEQYPHYPADVGVFSLRSVHAVEVDWTASDEAITASFIRWRAANRPTNAVILESRGRGGTRELLKFLGAYRLMQSFGKDSVAAAEWVDEHRPNLSRGKKSDGVPRYSDEAAWRKAARKAKGIIEKGIGLTPAGMLEGKMQASMMSAAQQARVAIAIEQAKKGERGRATLEEAERVLDNAKKTVVRSAKPAG